MTHNNRIIRCNTCGVEVEECECPSPIPRREMDYERANRNERAYRGSGTPRSVDGYLRAPERVRLEAGWRLMGGGE